MTLLARFAISGAIAAFASSLVSPEEAQGRVLGIVFFTLVVLGLIFDTVRLGHAWFNRDAGMIAKRQCPDCRTPKSLEVTSDEMVWSPENVQYREVVLSCTNCMESYIVEATLKEPNQ